MESIRVAIPDDAADRLRQLADREFRAPRQQAAALLVEAIERAERTQRRARAQPREAER